MTPEEEKYHFFRQHDTDHNEALDGLELMASLFHVNPYHVTHLTADATEQQVQQAHIGDREHNAALLAAIAAIIDKTLDKFDWNHDGQLDYTEYISGAVNMFTKSDHHGEEHHDQQQQQHHQPPPPPPPAQHQQPPQQLYQQQPPQQLYQQQQQHYQAPPPMVPPPSLHQQEYHPPPQQQQYQQQHQQQEQHYQHPPMVPQQHYEQQHH